MTNNKTKCPKCKMFYWRKHTCQRTQDREEKLRMLNEFEKVTFNEGYIKGIQEGKALAEKRAIEKCPMIIREQEAKIVELEKQIKYLQDVNKSDELNLSKAREQGRQSILKDIKDVAKCNYEEGKAEAIKEMLEDEIKFLNLGKVKIEGKTQEMEFLIRQRLLKLKKTLEEGK
jgi:hypothetical protein